MHGRARDPSGSTRIPLDERQARARIEARKQDSRVNASLKLKRRFRCSSTSASIKRSAVRALQDQAKNGTIPRPPLRARGVLLATRVRKPRGLRTQTVLRTRRRLAGAHDVQAALVPAVRAACAWRVQTMQRGSSRRPQRSRLRCELVAGAIIEIGVSGTDWWICVERRRRFGHGDATWYRNHASVLAPGWDTRIHGQLTGRDCCLCCRGWHGRGNVVGWRSR